MEFTSADFRTVESLTRGHLKVTGEDRTPDRPVPDGLLERLADLDMLVRRETYRGVEWEMTVDYDGFLRHVNGTRSLDADAVERERDALAIVGLVHSGHVDLWDLSDDEKELHSEGYALLDVLRAARQPQGASR